MISYKTRDLSLYKDVAELLCQVDRRLATLAKTKLDSLRYGSSCNRIDENKFFILANYKKILLAKSQNSSCLKQYLIDDIISNIKQYLTSGVIFKLKPGEVKESSRNKVPDYYSSNLSVNYTFTGSHDTNVYNYNSVQNENVTQIIEDSWEQIDW